MLNKIEVDFLRAKIAYEKSQKDNTISETDRAVLRDLYMCVEESINYYNYSMSEQEQERFKKYIVPIISLADVFRFE